MQVPTVPPARALDAPEPVAPVAVAASREGTCRNCEAPLAGEYCSRCGQFDAPLDPTMRELAGDAWESLTNVDGKVAASLRTLFTRPGTLTTEYLAGRRARYLPPFRLYLICSVAFFLVNSIDVDRPPTPSEAQAEAYRDSVARARIARGEVRDLGPSRSSPLGQRLSRGNDRLEASGREMSGVVTENIPNAMFVVLPAYALVLGVIYRSRRRRFPVHLVFALHAHAFFFATLAINSAAESLVELTRAPQRLETTIGLVMLLAWVAYFPVAMRRVYGGRWGVTVLRAVTLAVLYGVIAMALLSGVTVGYLWLLGA